MGRASYTGLRQVGEGVLKLRISGRRTMRPLALACGAALAALAGGGRAETLGDAIALAYQSNPTLQAQRATQRALDETYVQARAGYEPTLGAQASITTVSYTHLTLP